MVRALARHILQGVRHLIERDVEEWRVKNDDLELIIEHALIYAFLRLLKIKVAKAWQVLEPPVNVQHGHREAQLILKSLAQTRSANEAHFALQLLRIRVAHSQRVEENTYDVLGEEILLEVASLPEVVRHDRVVIFALTDAHSVLQVLLQLDLLLNHVNTHPDLLY